MDPELKKYLDNQFKSIDEKLKSIDERFKSIENEIQTLRNEMRNEILTLRNEMNERLYNLERGFYDLELRMKRHENYHRILEVEGGGRRRERGEDWLEEPYLEPTPALGGIAYGFSPTGRYLRWVPPP